MARKENDLTAFMLVQELNPNYYDWTDEEKKAIESKNIADITNIIGEKLYKNGMAVEEMHCIIHDKDSREVWDDTVNNYVIENKLIHIHCLVRFAKVDGKVMGGTPSKVSFALGVEPQYIEKPHKGKFAYDNMLAYLIHAKDEDKYQYKPSDVVTCGCMKDGQPLYRQYMDYYNERKRDWDVGRIKKKNDKAKIDVDILEEKILVGEIVSKNQVILTDEYYAIYSRNKHRIDDAFDTYAQRKIAKTIQAMENGEFRISVLFVTGKSGSGKSYFTDSLVKQIQKDAQEQFQEDWKVCDVASTNPFDEYLGEEILVMDDLRGISLTASDWLKLLDPDRINMGSARYKNKRMACRVIIINSEKDVLEFFYYLKNIGGDRSEAMDQFYRRIMARVKVYCVPDDIDVRRIAIGESQKADRYLADVPSSKNCNSDYDKLQLNYNFEKNIQDLEYDEAQHYLSDMIMKNNALKK